MLSLLQRINEALWFRRVPAKAYDLVRIGFACAALFNVLDLFTMRHELFYARGLIDRDAVVQNIGGDAYYSLFHYLDSTGEVNLVFLTAALSCVALGVGFLARLSALAVFVFYLSYTHYAFIALHGWDIILRIFSFLLLISPIGRTWSVDSLLRRKFRWPSAAKICRTSDLFFYSTPSVLTNFRQMPAV